jgi:FG-GAP repeat protein/fibronectin type III domain protein
MSSQGVRFGVVIIRVSGLLLPPVCRREPGFEVLGAPRLSRSSLAATERIGGKPRKWPYTGSAYFRPLGGALTVSAVPALFACLLVAAFLAAAGGTSGQVAETKLAASDGTAGDRFGDVSLSGDTAVVGAPLRDDLGTDSGSAYVFVRSGTAWSPQAKLTASDGGPGDQFGSPSISGDIVVIGAPADDGGRGSAYVFVRSGATWSQEAKLTASDGASGDRFGGSVAIHEATILVGATGVSNRKGAAYVFVRSGSTWSHEANLTALDGVPGDLFGVVSLSGDTAVIGAQGHDFAKGIAYVFTRDGTAWSEQANLAASDGIYGDGFGLGVSLSGDTAIVAAPFGNGVGYDSKKGAAYVFTRSGTTWSQEAKLTASDATADDSFGQPAVDGGIAVIGSAGDDDQGVSSGSAYIFVRTGTTWSQEAKVQASDGGPLRRYGTTVALSGSLVIVGAPGDNTHGPNAGAAYALDLSSSPSLPSAPQGLHPTPGDRQVLLNWAAPASDGGSAITKYRVYRGTDSSVELFLAETGNTSLSDTGLPNGVRFYYQVSAVNSIGEGPRSNEVSMTPGAPVVPEGLPGWVPYAALAVVIAMAEIAAGLLWGRHRARVRPPPT